MKTWRSGLLTILAVLMAVGLLLGCGGEAAPQIDCAAEKKAMLEQWESYLLCVEDVHTKMQWALDYAEDYLETDNWDSLLKARAAAAAAKQYIRNCTPPEFLLTDTQCAVLESAGIETDAVRSEFLALPGWLDQKAETMQNLGIMLEFDMMLSAEFSGMPFWLETNRGFLTDTAEYLCLMTNYVLVQMEETALWERIPGDFPQIGLGQGPWSEDLKKLMDDGTEALNRYEQRIGDLNQYAGLQEYSTKVIREALETGDLQYLERELHLPTGVPGCFPDPGWFTAETQRYYLQSAEHLMIYAGDDLAQPPTGCYITCPGISRTDVEAYYDSLVQWGFQATEKWEETEEKYVVFAIHESCSLLVEWTEEKTLVYLPEPVGALIPDLYLRALLVE